MKKISRRATLKGVLITLPLLGCWRGGCSVYVAAVHTERSPQSCRCCRSLQAGVVHRVTMGSAKVTARAGDVCARPPIRRLGGAPRGPGAPDRDWPRGTPTGWWTREHQNGSLKLLWCPKQPLAEAQKENPKSWKSKCLLTIPDFGVNLTSNPKSYDFVVCNERRTLLRWRALSSVILGHLIYCSLTYRGLAQANPPAAPIEGGEIGRAKQLVAVLSHSCCTQVRFCTVFHIITSLAQIQKHKQ